MGQFQKLLASLSLKQKISIAVVAAVIIAAIYGFTSWLHERDFKPLYTGVASEDAAAIVQKIKENGSDYRLSESGGVISVPSSRVAELRLALAAAGLPKSGRIGFELFDKTSFGTTEFVEHINYNRALEGELERSIGSLSAIEQARVHITAAKESVFVEQREPGKASVILRLKPGATLLPQNVTAIQQLVSSAVEGVSPEDVSVVDTRGSLLSHKKAAQDDSTDAAYAYRERMEHEYVEKINSTLEPLLGAGRFHAGVTVDCDMTTSEQDEETFDPAKSVMASSRKTEEVVTGGSTAGIPGTATNLPRPAARVGGPTNSTTRRTEDVNYQSSHLIRKTHIPEGQIKRLSISVLLDQKAQWQGKGKAAKLVPVPPTPETIKAVHDLVAGVTGFAQDRGDQITIESLPFEATLDQASPAGPSAPAAKPTWKEMLKNPMVMIAAGAGAGLMLLLAGVAFILMRKKKPAAQASATVAAPLSVEDAKAKASLQAANSAEQFQAALADRVAEQEKADMAALAALKIPMVSTKKTELLTKEIRETMKKDPAVSAHVIQSWLHE